MNEYMKVVSVKEMKIFDLESRVYELEQQIDQLKHIINRLENHYETHDTTNTS